MGHNKGDRRADLRARADTYKIPIKFSEGELDQCTDFGKYDVFGRIFNEEYEHLFKVTTATFNDTDAWPTNFLGLAGRQYVAGSPNVRVRFIHPVDIPMMTRNARVAGTATQPVCYTSDQKFYFLPHTTTGVTIEHYLFPRPLQDPTITDDQTDTMPEFSEPDITASAFEFMLKMMLDQQSALELSQAEIAHTERTIAMLYADKFKMLNQEVQLTD